MVDTAYQQDTKELLTKITALHEFISKNGDDETADKAKQLALKLSGQEFSIAFCGHFSAGKSSMINRIVGENLLPSSPIPTSANLVKIKSGDEYAKVFFKKGNPRLYQAPYNYDKVKTFCKDGDQIQSIEISHITNLLPKNAVIMDTPGIDSTDDAHRIATESALHLADLVFYVMDYNHVQSELNFLFTKELTEAGKEVYLAINQIDKHREEELSFPQFKRSVEESFASWGVKPAEIFYTSLKVGDHPHNRFQQLQQFIQAKIAQREELLPHSVFHSLKKLITEHQSFLEEKHQEKLEQYNELLSSLSYEEQQSLETELKVVEEELTGMASVIKNKEEDLRNSVENVLKNAYLMPFQTRELAEKYLQSKEADFKVGLFFTKQKTEQERQQRLEQFFRDFQEKVKSQLEWHLKELLQNTFKKDAIHDSSLLNQIQQFSVPITSDVLEGAVKAGARLSGDYVLNYTNDVAEAAKRIARNQLREIQESYLQLLRKKQEQRKSELVRKRDQLSEWFKAFKQKQEILETQTAALIQMEQYLSGHFDLELFKDLTDVIISYQEEVEIIINSAVETEAEVEIGSAKAKAKQEDFSERKLARNETDQFHQIVNRLRFSAKELHEVPGFKKLTGELIEKADRLESRGFTVALFGAFSAGKSSFANALIGEKLLPVSPNPTTAAINKIVPINKENGHGTVKVQLKEKKVMFEDVNRSLAVFDLKADDFNDALEKIKKVMTNTNGFDSMEKTHFAFLNAFYKGFGPYREQLGEIITTDINDFRDFVANEEKSCLVETIEVFFDCELTRKGITLVDTPGADSINARHTGVAFEYIKNSDAILFVTYYNHAFSKADREFLIQLGRVKDSFELDKMFFMVNAVDLANDEEEKQDVLNYVEQQLIKYGIRRPHLFPISSMLAIEEKLEKQTTSQSGIDRFEEEFYSFITNDLTDIAINSAQIEMERAVELLRSYIHTAQEDNEHKVQKMQALKEEHKEVEKMIKNQSVHVLIQRLNQEIDELSYYIKQRVFFRFNDFFKEAFNPTVLKDDGRNLKRALQHSLDEFLKDFGFDFAQELRATTLRIESFIGKLLEQSYKIVTADLVGKNQELSFSPYEMKKIEGISFESAFDNIDREIFKKGLSYFKNPKSFFENNEKRFMIDAFEKAIQHPADDYLMEEKERLKAYYNDELSKELNSFVEHLCEEAEEYYEGMYATLSNEIPVEKLMELEKKIVNYS